jgi:hypothetical protein
MTQYTDEEILDKIIEFFETEGRWPKLRDMRTPYPSKTMIARRFCSEDGKADGFGRALTMAQIELSYREIIAKSKSNIFTRIKRWLGC